MVETGFGGLIGPKGTRPKSVFVSGSLYAANGPLTIEGKKVLNITTITMLVECASKLLDLWSHVAACLVVGWLQFVIFNLIIYK